jgi:hypothetical protein
MAPINEIVSEYIDDQGVDVNSLIAHLVLDDQNQADPGNAVRVEIDGKTVGFLAQHDAMLYRQRLLAIGLPSIVGICAASIAGGWLLQDGTQADFNIRLDLDLSTFKPHEPHKPARHPPPGV